MIEFGSDFHLVASCGSSRRHLTDVFPGALLLADGRQSIVLLIRQHGWKRIWIPEYFCYEVIGSIEDQTGIRVMYYEENPMREAAVESLPFAAGDVLLRVNFFGLRGFRSNRGIPCPVIEDHTHDLLGPWAAHSDADWCIASLRKTLPVPEGGMLWSPKGLPLPAEVRGTEENERIAATRWEGMALKARYLDGAAVRKEDFRKCYTETEEWFDHALPVAIDDRSRAFLSQELDLERWQDAKRSNWCLLRELVRGCDVLAPEEEACTAFSLVLLFESRERRDEVRKQLIGKAVYPAILWAVPDGVSGASKDFSGRMLSVHCDGRYSGQDIRQLAGMLNKLLESK